MKTRFGNFLPDGLHASFDNAFFRISPREARSLDPQMRVVMRVGLQAIESAGLVVSDSKESDSLGQASIRSDDVGCFIGAATNDYAHNLRGEIGVHYATGKLYDILRPTIDFESGFSRYSSRVPCRPSRICLASLGTVFGC